MVNYIRILIAISLCTLTSALKSQSKTALIDSINTQLELNAAETLVYQFKYNHSLEEIEIGAKDGGEIKSEFKAIITDIHPKGIFEIKKKQGCYLRILSLRNNHVFIKKEKGLSSNIQLIDLGPFKDDFCKQETSLSALIQLLIPDNESEEKPSLVAPPSTKGDRY